MAPITQKYQHIAFNERGTPIVEGTRIKVPLLIMGHLAYKWGAEQLQIQYPSLTLGQIHSALAYYYENKDLVDREITDRERAATDFHDDGASSPLRQKLRALKAKLDAGDTNGD